MVWVLVTRRGTVHPEQRSGENHLQIMILGAVVLHFPRSLVRWKATEKGFLEILSSGHDFVRREREKAMKVTEKLWNLLTDILLMWVIVTSPTFLAPKPAPRTSP